MTLSRFYTWITTRTGGFRRAVLSDEMLQTLINRYHVSEPLANVKYIQSYFSELTNKSDLVVEWVLKSISRGSGRYPEDIHRFENTLRFFFDQYKTPKFKNLVQGYARDNHIALNPNNLLDFTLHQLEDLRDLFYEELVDPRVIQLQTRLPEGSDLFYNDGTYQIVRVTSSEAACTLAKGTKWCTSDEKAANSYLDISPLYIIYIKGKKTAQLHIAIDMQSLMDLRDRALEPDENFRQVLIKSGLMEQVITSLDYESDSVSELDPQYIRRWLGEKDNPQIRNMVYSYPVASLMYSMYVLKGRFPEAEPSIARDPYTAFEYAVYVLKDRFPLAEGFIISSDVLDLYADFLWSKSRKIYLDFLNAHPRDRGLDPYHEDLESLPSHTRDRSEENFD